MAFDPSAIRLGLAEVITQATGLRMDAWEPDQLNVPCGYVMAADPFLVEPDEAFSGGLCQVEVIVRIVGSEAAGVARGLKALDPYLASGAGMDQSVIDAIYGDTTLGGRIPGGALKIIEVGAPRQVDTLGGVVYIGADIPVRIYVPRT